MWYITKVVLMEMLSTYRLTASQLVSLLQILGALVADYRDNPNGKIRKELAPLVKSALQWKELPGLQDAVKAATTGGDKLSALYNLGAELKSAFSKFHNNTEYSAAELQLLKAIRSYLMTDSDSALKYIIKNASIFNAPELSDAFMPEIPKADNASLRKIVKSLVGREDVSLSLPESQLIKETNPKSHNDSFKAMLMNYVRAQKKKLVPYQQAYAYLYAQGFTHSMVPGFTGLIDDQGKWYTLDGKVLGGVPNLMTYSHVLMNPGKDKEQQWVFKAIKHDGGAAYGYTDEFKKSQSKAKYERVRGLLKKIPAIRKKWLTEVQHFNIEDKQSVAAVILELLYSFAARVGSAPGRGVATLVASQARTTQQGINLAYLGKDSIPTKHVLKDSDPIHKRLIEALTQLLKDKKGNEYIFTYEVQGKLAAFRAFGAPAELSVHKIRTCRGTFTFLQLVEQDKTKRPPKDEKEALLRYERMTEEVGKLLNHKRGVGGSNEKVTGTTAAGSYIDGDAQLDLWSSWGFRPPKALEKLTRGEDE